MKYTFTLDAQQTHVVLAGLAELPFKISANTITDLQRQAIAQEQAYARAQGDDAHVKQTEAAE